jgi:hypothetical protein
VLCIHVCDNYLGQDGTIFVHALLKTNKPEAKEKEKEDDENDLPQQPSVS